MGNDCDGAPPNSGCDPSMPTPEFVPVNSGFILVPESTDVRPMGKRLPLSWVAVTATDGEARSVTQRTYGGVGCPALEAE